MRDDKIKLLFEFIKNLDFPVKEQLQENILKFQLLTRCNEKYRIIIHG